MAAVDKEALRAELERALAAELDVLERAHKATREAATHEEAKPENDKDTRALEQSYLARGQAIRANELRAAVADVSAMPLRAFAEDAPAALGAVVFAEEEAAGTGAPAVLVLFLAPHGGGTRLAAGSVQVITPVAPLGRALLGKRAGDEVELVLAGKTRSLSVVRVE